MVFLSLWDEVRLLVIWKFFLSSLVILIVFTKTIFWEVVVFRNLTLVFIRNLYRTVKFDQNTEKSPGDLCRLVTQAPEEDNRLTLVLKALMGIIEIITTTTIMIIRFYMPEMIAIDYMCREAGRGYSSIQDSIDTSMMTRRPQKKSTPPQKKKNLIAVTWNTNNTRIYRRTKTRKQ